MKKLIITLSLVLGILLNVQAQQDAEYNMYMFNGLFLNPAYAGSHDALDLTAIYRHQWAGLDGAPRTFNASVHSPLKRDQYALGLTLANDRLGLTNMFSATGAFAYRIKLDKKGVNRIALGVQLGFTYYQQRNTQARTYDPINNYDPTFATNTNLWLPNIGAGVYFVGKRYNVGFSVPHMLPSSLSDKWKLETSDVIARQYNHFLLTAGYIFGKDTWKVKIKPSFLMKYQQGLRYNIPDFDLNLNFLFVERVWVGVGVRTGGDAFTATMKQKKFGVEGVIAMVEGKITPQLRAGYAYHYAFTSLRSYEKGTHEIMLGYQFSFNKKRFVTPRYLTYF